jgi:hypothetical protein
VHALPRGPGEDGLRKVLEQRYGSTSNPLPEQE